MGRQKGEGARSKSRPSSSSLAASLLPSGSAAAAVGFGGFVGSSRLDPPSSSEDSLPFADVDSEIAVHLKRLGRKDPTTKLKALAALSMLLQQKSAKENVLVVPQWAFEYKRLLLDYNREVRRATHDTMTALVTSVGLELF
ncbi:E3 ubiquitin-protein ligase listerin [Spatholobus suberectus]|nr:E3 ubiquitin-protein ligase listerin [Spatholobus suberectus]